MRESKSLIMFLLSACFIACTLQWRVIAAENSSATEQTVFGIYDLSISDSVENVSINVQDATGTEIEASMTPLEEPVGGTHVFYREAARLILNYQAANKGRLYFAAITKDGNWEDDRIFYLDQKTATDGSIQFDLYPKEMEEGAYVIYLTDNAQEGKRALSDSQPVASFSYCVYHVVPEETFTIDYVLNGGTNHPDNPSAYKKGDHILLKDPKKPGFLFKGWYLDKKLTSRITEITEENTGVITLYAKWKKEEPAQKDISGAEITLTKQEYVYTGAEITPVPVVALEGKELVPESDYTISYENHVNAGTATITITGKGAYSGSTTTQFRIILGKTTRGDMFNLAGNVKVTWKEVPGAKYYKVYREGITKSSESVEEPVIITSQLIGWDKVESPALVNGHAYRYRIVASMTGKDKDGKNDSSGDSKLSYSKLMYRLKTVVIRSVKNTAPGKVTVKYDKTTSGDSYVLQWSEHEDMSNAKTKVVLGADNTSYVIGGLKKGKTYYISIRVRKKVEGIDYYTTFGVAKKIKLTQ